MKNVKVNYVNNEALLEELKEWQQQGEDAMMPDSIAKAIMQICENLALSGRFVGYSWREDMVGDAILVCIKSARNFNPEKSENPFAYFTQIAYNAFRRYLNLEHTRLATIEAYKQTVCDGLFESDDTGDDYNNITEAAQKHDTIYQKQYTIKVRQKKKNHMETLFE